MKRHIAYLDGWRGLAIACLLIGHFFPVPGINFGSIGVALFFVLSGLLMSQVLFVQRTDFGTFYRRRIARVFPSVIAYIATICVVFMASNIPIVPAELVPAATFTNNYLVTQNWTMPLGHIWSLSVEEHSYVILSVAAFWCRRRGGRGFAAIGTILLAVIGAIAFYSLMPGTGISSFQLRTEVASFGIFASGLLVLLLVHGKIRLNQPWMAPGALAVGMLAQWWSIPAAVQIIVGCGALAISINGMQSAPSVVVRLFESWWLRKLGLYSFSLYLWQQPYYQLCRHYGMSPWLGLVLAVITGIVAYYLIENPARLYINQHWGVRRAAAINASGGVAE